MSNRRSSKQFSRQFRSNPAILDEQFLEEELQYTTDRREGEPNTSLVSTSMYLNKSLSRISIPKRPTFNPLKYSEPSLAVPTTPHEIVDIETLDIVQEMKQNAQLGKIPVTIATTQNVPQLTTRTTLSIMALRGIAQFEKLVTLPMKAFKRTSHLDNLGTIPVAVLQGVEEKANGVLNVSNMKIRIVGVLFVGVAFFYVSWLIQVLNKNMLWFSLPFLFATIYTTSLVCITIYNNWYRSMPIRVKVSRGQEPTVAVLIPTYGEPVEMLQTTIESVLAQEWSDEKFVVIVGDDSHKQQVRDMVETMQENFAPAHILYHEPPRKGDPARKTFYVKT